MIINHKVVVLVNLLFEPLCFDSFSVRSMATLVTIGNADTSKSKSTGKNTNIGKSTKILIDPGIALGPSRFGLEPSKQELKAFDDGRAKIINKLGDVSIVTISHYHFDHHPFYDDNRFNKAAYHNKIVFAKDNKKNINHSQKERGFVFENIVKKLTKTLFFSDGKTIESRELTQFNDIISNPITHDFQIRFSKPVFHGREKSRLGYVIMVKVTYKNDSVMHCSDVQGPIAEETTRIIIKENPKHLIIGGPPTYLLGFKFTKRDLERAKENVLEIIRKTQVKTLIIDHHLLRDLRFRERFDVYEEAKNLGCEVKTAAEYLGIKNEQLEARRKELSKKVVKEK